MEVSLVELIRSSREFGGAGIPIVAMTFFLGALAFLPRMPVCVAAGLVFGLAAFPVALIASTAGASAGFLLSRHLFQSWFRHLVGQRPRWNRLLSAIDSESWVLVGLLRLASPVPGSATTYLFGLTRIRFWPFTVATLIGLVPQTFAFIYLGTAAELAFAGHAVSTTKVLVAVGGALTSVACVVLIGRRAQAAVTSHLERPDLQ